ncbi:AlpA family transcriptional regulator [Acinetobacter sp. R933-2]|uniref:AlpA family transcriptional regulator n=1 Tax=Acinetobacter TaxID=469 RepID=UPI002578878B|nr:MULTISPECIES: AlpA family transcriptional regulator [Acinetobacter]MDM1249281.1 AlpA family transcriptional regulator [Acinetobacter sp. R933-2]MDY6462795.1 AlpA family transcriptional regulator [Acinetobacter faecalis]
MISNTAFDIVVNGIVLKPLRLKKKEVCDYLKFSVEQLRKVSMNDESFPRPIKTGSTRQSGVYYDFNEIMCWKEKNL